MPRWGMVIDLRKCIGCKSCVVGCNEANRFRKIPEKGERLRCHRYPERHRIFLHLSCMQCSELLPGGLPDKATYKRPDGIVSMTMKDVRCSYCIVACPYRAGPSSPASSTLLQGLGHERMTKSVLSGPASAQNVRSACPGSMKV